MSLYHTPVKKITLICIFLLNILFFAGCTEKAEQEPIHITGLKLNTLVEITIYDSRDQTLLEECLALCDQYEKIFSRTDSESELYMLNHRQLPAAADQADTFVVSQELADLISTGLSYSRLSQGAFDLAIEPLSSLWDFGSEDPQVPDEALIQKALAKCDYRNVSVSGNQVTLKTEDTALELGAVAKGYIADRIKDYLVSQGVGSAIIDLGGNVLCIGSKPDGTPFKIGVQKPFANRNETIALMDIRDKSVVSSGVYERYFQQDGVLYHHLLDPGTGYPYDNGLLSVTIISDKSVDGDALSTTCFALGLEDGLAFAQKQGMQAIFITSDYTVHYTEGFQDEIPVSAL